MTPPPPRSSSLGTKNAQSSRQTKKRRTEDVPPLLASRKEKGRGRAPTCPPVVAATSRPPTATRQQCLKRDFPSLPKDLISPLVNHSTAEGCIHPRPWSSVAVLDIVSSYIQKVVLKDVPREHNSAARIYMYSSNSELSMPEAVRLAALRLQAYIDFYSETILSEWQQPVGTSLRMPDFTKVNEVVFRDARGPFKIIKKKRLTVSSSEDPLRTLQDRLDLRTAEKQRLISAAKRKKREEGIKKDLEWSGRCLWSHRELRERLAAGLKVGDESEDEAESSEDEVVVLPAGRTRRANSPTTSQLLSSSPPQQQHAQKPSSGPSSSRSTSTKDASRTSSSSRTPRRPNLLPAFPAFETPASALTSNLAQLSSTPARSSPALRTSKFASNRILVNGLGPFVKGLHLPRGLKRFYSDNVHDPEKFEPGLSTMRGELQPSPLFCAASSRPKPLRPLSALPRPILPLSSTTPSTETLITPSGLLPPPSLDQGRAPRLESPGEVDEPSQEEGRERRVNSEDMEVDEASPDPEDRSLSPASSSIHSLTSKSATKLVDASDAEVEDEEGEVIKPSARAATPSSVFNDDDAKSTISNLLTPQSAYSIIPPPPRSTNPSNWNRHQNLRLSPSRSPSHSSRRASRSLSRSLSSSPFPRETLSLKFIHDPSSPRQETMGRRKEIRKEWQVLRKKHEDISKRLFVLDQEVRRLDVREVLGEQGYRVVEEGDWEDEVELEMEE